MLKKDHGGWIVGVTVYFVEDDWPEYRDMQPTSATCCGDGQYYRSMPPKAVSQVDWFDCGGAYGINTRPIISLSSSVPTLPNFIGNHACSAGKEKLVRQLGIPQ